MNYFIFSFPLTIAPGEKRFKVWLDLRLKIFELFEYVGLNKADDTTDSVVLSTLDHYAVGQY